MRRKSNKYKVLPIKVIQLRMELGLTQADFVSRFNEFLTKKKLDASISLPLASSWETGRRNVSAQFVQPLASFYKVSEDYLYGFTDDKKGELSDEERLKKSAGVGTSANDPKNGYLIPRDNFYLYDQKAVYVVYKAEVEAPRWGLLDVTNKRVVTLSNCLDIDNQKQIFHDLFEEEKANIYTNKPNNLYTYGEGNRKRLDRANMLHRKSVYVEMMSPNAMICGKYNGWYHHNEDNTALINAVGYVLPYDGLGVSFTCYSDSIDMEAGVELSSNSLKKKSTK